MGSFISGGYGVPLRVPLQGSIGRLGFRFRGSYKWGCAPHMGHSYSYPTYNYKVYMGVPRC